MTSPKSGSDAASAYKEAFAHFAEGDLDAAIAGFRRTLELDPKLALAWNGLSMALAQSGDLAGGIEAARKLVELEPHDALSYTNLSRLLQKNGMIPEAEDAAAEATRLQMQQQSERR